MNIEWSDIEPSERDRGAVERAFAGLLDERTERVVIKRRGSGYEARVVLDLYAGTTSLKLQAETLLDVVERVAEIVRIVAASRSQR